MDPSDAPAVDDDLTGYEPDLDEPDDAGITEFEQRELLEVEQATAAVSYTGQDFDVDGLVRRLRRGDILVPNFGHHDTRIDSAGFQRSFVWSKPQMDRFIESMLLGYPIPGIFLVRQADRRYLVLDGQQRLKTLQYFYSGVFDQKVFQLINVSESFKGLTYETLSDDQRRLLDNTFLQATVVATDGSQASLDSVYQIFERLNSGGTQLTPHEIRVALFAGPFIDYLEELNSLEQWRRLYGKRSPRLRDQELVLRILAYYVMAPAYRRPLKTFLNNFAAQYRTLINLPGEDLRERFSAASNLLDNEVGRNGFIRQGYQINVAFTEAVFVGLMRALESGRTPAGGAVAEVVDALRENQQLQGAISRATADEENVRVRLELATAAFAKAM